VDEIATMLLAADSPLLITGYSGRHPLSVKPLIELAEAISARVIESPSRMNFPSTHSLYQGFDPNPYLEKADVILVIDNDVPYIPAQVKPRPGTKTIHIDIDPLKSNIPLWGFPVDILVQADSGQFLPALNRIIRQKITAEKTASLQKRFQLLQDEHRKEKWRTWP
jgi:acetolactate synthase-1/2/3 large subunit